MVFTYFLLELYLNPQHATRLRVISAIVERRDSTLPEIKSHAASVKRERCRSRIMARVRNGPLYFSIIVNSNKRERAHATLRVGHKAAWRRKRGMVLVVAPSRSSDSGSGRPVSFYDVTHGPRARMLRLVR